MEVSGKDGDVAIDLSGDVSKEEIEAAVMKYEKTALHLQGRKPRKVIVVPGKIVNIVV